MVARVGWLCAALLLGLSIGVASARPAPQYFTLYDPAPPQSTYIPCGPRVILYESHHWLQPGEQTAVALFIGAGLGTVIWSAGPAQNAWAQLPPDGSTGAYLLQVPLVAPLSLQATTLTLTAAPEACPAGGLRVQDLNVVLSR